MRGLLTLLTVVGLVGLVGAQLMDGATAAILLCIALLIGLGPRRVLQLVVGLLLMLRGFGL